MQPFQASMREKKKISCLVQSDINSFYCQMEKEFWSLCTVVSETYQNEDRDSNIRVSKKYDLQKKMCFFNVHIEG